MVIHDFTASEKFNAMAENTKKAWRYSFRLAEHPDTLGGLSVQEVDAAFVQAFLDGLADRPAIQERTRKALKALEKWAIVRRKLPKPITLGTEVIGCRGAREPWTDEEVRLAEQYARPDLARVVTLAAMTGQRLGDLCRMRWGDVGPYRGRLGIDLTQEKTSTPLWCPIIHEFEPVLNSWDRSSLWIIAKANGSPWARQELSVTWHKHRKRNPALAPLEARRLSLHGLRATATLRLRRDGLSNAYIGKVVGMSEAMVNRYCRRADQADEAVRAMELRERTRGEHAQVISLNRASNPLK